MSPHLLLILASIFSVDNTPTPTTDTHRPPNVVIIFTDDQGWADIGANGGTHVATPNLDRMATEGLRFTDFYVAQPVCSASRAALLTGCYPNRIGIAGALNPNARHGIHDDEITLAEICKTQGYATAAYGKWHLGHHAQFLPVNHGFDDYFGIPYSNDMWPQHPEARKGTYPPLPLIEDDQVIETSPDQGRFTTEFTQRAIDFIKAHKDEPFFVYLAHPMPHVPLAVHKTREDATGMGTYADVIGEIDWSVGQILNTLDELDLDSQTIVLFMSDNGPWLSYGNHAGQTGHLREGKGTTFEGGVRVPSIARWPGRIPANQVTSAPVMTIDVLPTIADLIDAPVPNAESERPIDGRSYKDLLLGKPGAESPQETYYFYYHDNDLEAMRHNKWKLHFPHRYRTMNNQVAGNDGSPGKYDYSAKIGLALFDLEVDPSEAHNVAHEHPEVVAQLVALADKKRQALGDRLTKTQGKENRAPGRVPESTSESSQDE